MDHHKPDGQRGLRGWTPSSQVPSGRCRKAGGGPRCPDPVLPPPGQQAAGLTAGVKVLATHRTDTQGYAAWVGAQAEPPPRPQDKPCAPRQLGAPGGRPRTLDDGTLLLLEGGPGGRPGQQQLLLVKQAVQQVLLPTAVVDFQESQDGEGQPGQPRGPEAKLQ